MTDEAGGFYSAEDADSLPPEDVGKPGAHAMEGAFYLWRASELAPIVGEDEPIVRQRFGIEENGNAPADPHGEFTGKNLVYLARSVEEIANDLRKDPDEVNAALDRARLRLFEHRVTRPHPYLDDKVLTAWNGLMIAAFARAARVVQLVRPGWVGVSRRRAPGRDVHPRPHVERGHRRRCCAGIAGARRVSRPTPRTTRT